MQEYFDELVEGTSVIQLLIEQNWNVPETEEVLLSISSNNIRTLFLIVQWEYLDLMRCGRTLTDNDTSEESISQIQALVDAVCSLRTKLIDVALSWMDESMVLKPTKSSRHLQREAFRLVSEVRALFPVKLSEYLYLESAAYSPSEEVLLAMKRVFDSERTLVNEALANLDDSEESKQSGKELSAILVNNLLVPIKDGALNDMKNTNRRQMAAIVSCIADPSEQVQDVVKTLIKKLKDYDVVKYMEIQLLSLKNCYLENVKPHLLSPPEEDSENENEQELIEASYEVSENLSRKLALTMGVGKLKGKHLDALMSFFRAGMTFALSDAKHIGFVQLLQNYFKFLPFNCFSILSNELSALVENCTDVADEIAAWDEDSNMELRRLLCFRDALEGGCKKIVSRGADDDFKRSQINISRNNHDDNSSGGQTSDEESETTGTKGYVPSRKTSSRAPSMRLSANSTVSQKSDKAMAWKGNSRDKPPGTDGANEFSLGLQLEEVPELSSESSEMSSSKRPSKRKGSVEDTEDTTEMDRIPSRRRYR